jgi:hypothetical protein
MAYKASTIIQQPNWFKLPPINVPNSDFHIGNEFPRDFVVPTNKMAIMEGEIDADMELSTGTYAGASKLFQYGFTVVSILSEPPGSNYAGAGKRMALMANASQWQDGPVNANLASLGMVICDSEFEFTNPPNETANAFAARILSNPANAGKYLGRWAVASNGKTWLYSNGPNGFPPTGVYNAAGAALWRAEYNNTNSTGSAFNLSVPYFYETESLEYNYYEIFQCCEVGKKRDPNIKQIPSLWIYNEMIDDAENIPVVDTMVNGVLRSDALKVSASAEYIYSSALICLACFDGYYHFGAGNVNVNDINYYDFNYFYPIYGGKGAKIINGVSKQVIYTPRCQGLNNYIVLANWQLSQEPFKSIIEASTPWLMPEMGPGANAAMTITGDLRFPSYGALNKSPIMRIKYNAAGTKVIFVAIHPFQELASSTWSFRDPANTWDSYMTMHGAWATLGTFDL